MDKYQTEAMDANNDQINKMIIKNYFHKYKGLCKGVEPKTLRSTCKSSTTRLDVQINKIIINEGSIVHYILDQLVKLKRNGKTKISNESSLCLTT